MTTVFFQPLAAASSIPSPRRHNRVLRAVLLSLFAAPAFVPLAAFADEPLKQAVFPEILVQGKPEASRAPGTKTVITSDDLDRRGATGMSGIIRYEPLVSAPLEASGGGSVWDGAGNSGYNIRGIEGNRVSLEVDGINLPDAAPKPDGNTMNSFGIGRDYIDPEIFREVRISSGTTGTGSSAPGLGGSVAFVTKSPEDYLGGGRDTYVSYKYGHFSANRSQAQTLTGAAKVDILQALAVFVNRKGHESKSLGDSPLNPDAWHSSALLLKLVWDLPGEQKLDMTFDGYERYNGRAYNNKQSALYPEGTKQDSRTRRSRISAGHQVATHDFALFDTLTSKIYLQDAEVQDFTTGPYVSQAVAYLRDIRTGLFNNSYGFTTEAFKQVGARHALSYGLNGEQLSTTRPWYEDRTVVRTGAHQITRKNRMADMDTTTLSAFVRDDISLVLGAYKAMLTPGLRVQYRNLKPKNLENYIVAVPAASKEIKEHSDTYLTPSLGLRVEVLDGVDAYAQYSRGTRLPTPAETTGTYDSFSYTGSGSGYAVLGNPDLQKETSNAFELGLKGALAKGLTFRTALFYTKYKNFIDYASQPIDRVNYPTIVQGLFRPQNLAEARTWGGEFSLRAELGTWAPALRGFHLDAAAGVVHGSTTNTLTGNSAGLASVAPYKGSATLGYDHAAQLFGLALNATKVGAKQAPAEVNTGTTAARFAVPGYALVDLAGYWNINPHVKLTAGVYNLGNRKYWDYASSRGLPAETTAATHADIERQALPGRNLAASLSVNF